MSEIVIRADGLGKQYRIGEAQARNDTLRDALAASVGRAWRGLRRLSRPSRRERFWALRDVSFELARGEVLGIIGHNGARMSTLLKILSRITEPTSGEVMIRGRVGSLLEVGTGFHSELTGRENIYLNGAILGMTRAEIDRKFDEIVAFAGIDRFVDTPVKHYSSGMYLRLGFSVAAHLEPEILLVDEILAVGDAEFQKKCLGRMNEVAREGRTVIFVSHNLDAIQRLCTRCMMLDGGQVAAYGPTADVVAAYLSRGRGPVDAGERVDLSSANRQGGSGVRFLSAVFGSGSAEAANRPYTGGPLEVALEIQADSERVVESLAISIRTLGGTLLVNADVIELGQPVHLEPGANTVVFRIDALHLNPGRYMVSLWAGSTVSTLDYIEEAFEIEVVGLRREALGMTPAENGLVPCAFSVETVPGPAQRMAREALP